MVFLPGGDGGDWREPRMHTEARAEIRLDGQQEWRVVTLLNLSSTGALLRIPIRVAMGTQLRLRVPAVVPGLKDFLAVAEVRRVQRLPTTAEDAGGYEIGCEFILVH